jgi:hypothetical protein
MSGVLPEEKPVMQRGDDAGEDADDDVGELITSPKKSRGRPRMHPIVLNDEDADEITPKRGPGRPRAKSIVKNDEIVESDAPKSGPGRPRKHLIASQIEDLGLSGMDGALPPKTRAVSFGRPSLEAVPYIDLPRRPSLQGSSALHQPANTPSAKSNEVFSNPEGMLPNPLSRKVIAYPGPLKLIVYAWAFYSYLHQLHINPHYPSSASPEIRAPLCHWTFIPSYHSSSNFNPKSRKSLCWGPNLRKNGMLEVGSSKTWQMIVPHSPLLSSLFRFISSKG